MRRPAAIRYGLEDRPPWPVIAMTAVQQATVVFLFLYVPVIIAREAQAGVAQTTALIATTFLACGLGTMLQALPRIGSGFLAPLSPSTPYLAPAVLAAQLGGLPLVAGMTLAAGLASIALARLLHRIRSLMPPEIAGVVVLIVGLAISITGLRTLMRSPGGAAPEAEDILVGLATLALSVALSVWGRGALRWACVLIAMALGTALAAALGRLHLAPDLDLAAMPLVGLPALGGFGLAFDLALLPAFLVAALASALKTVGLVTGLQRTNDADWSRPEPRSLAGGVTADGIATALAGLLGATGVNVSATNAALQSATGVSSRVIAFATGGICIALACFPRLAALLSQVPAPVIAATLLQAGALMMAAGMQLATSRLLDARKSAAVGLAIVAALSVEAVPQLADWVGEGLRPLMTAGALGTLVAIALNAVLRIGIGRRVSITHRPAAMTHDVVAAFLERAGGTWALRADLVARVANALNWCLDAIQGAGLAQGPVTLTLAYDEARLDVRLAYTGTRVELADRPPTPDELLHDDAAPARLAGHMIRRLSDRVTVREKDGVVELRMSLND
jgi:NCS2 family nucleobase:cation symporter-2